MTRPIRQVGVVAALAVLALSGCASSIDADDPHTEHTEAWTELDGLLTAALTTIGGEWGRLDSGATPCGRLFGTGAQAPLGRTGHDAPLERQQAVADEIVTQWAAQNVTASVGVDR